MCARAAHQEKGGEGRLSALIATGYRRLTCFLLCSVQAPPLLTSPSPPFFSFVCSPAVEIPDIDCPQASIALINPMTDKVKCAF